MSQVAGLEPAPLVERRAGRAQDRVDADKRAHSPGGVVVNQKGVDTASADLVQAQAAENTADRGTPDGSAADAGRILSITA